MKIIGPLPYRPAFVYSLVAPDGRMYIGSTIDPVARLRKHLTGKQIERSKLLLSGSEPPKMIVIEACSESDVRARETYWIHAISEIRTIVNFLPWSPDFIEEIASAHMKKPVVVSWEVCASKPMVRRAEKTTITFFGRSDEALAMYRRRAAAAMSA